MSEWRARLYDAFPTCAQGDPDAYQDSDTPYGALRQYHIQDHQVEMEALETR